MKILSYNLLTFSICLIVTPAAMEMNSFSGVTSGATSLRILGTTFGFTAMITTELFDTSSVLSVVMLTPVF